MNIFKLNSIIITLLLSFFSVKAQWYPLSFQSYDIEFANDEIGYISGYGGMLKKTVDGGNSWFLLNSKTIETIYDLDFISELIGFGVCSNGEIIKTINGGETWIKLNSPTTNDISFVKFSSEDDGYILSSAGRYSLTSDGGNSWEAMTNTYAGAVFMGFFNSINFVSSTNGFVCGSSYMYETTDGGATWNNSGIQANYSFFLDNTNGWAIGRYSSSGSAKIYITTDGGANWSEGTLDIEEDVKRIIFIDENVGYITFKNGVIAKSTDGGLNWSQLNSGVTQDFNSISFTNDKLYIVGESSIIHSSTDEGVSWVVESIVDTVGAALKYNTVTYTDSMTWFIGTSNGIILKSIDGGVNWNYNNKISNSILDMFFVNETLGFLAGSEGGIYKTNDSGDSWQEQNTPSLKKLHSIYFLNENKGYAVGEFKAFFVTEDGGATWADSSSQLFGGSSSTLTDIEFINDDIGFLSGPSSMYKTNDGGDTWNIVSSYNGNDLFFISDSIGFMVGSEVYKTIDQGNTWTIIHTPSSGSSNYSSLAKVHFYNDLEGIVVDKGSYGHIYVTTDGGYSWNIEEMISFARSFYDIGVASKKKTIVCGGSRNIFRKGGYEIIIDTPTDLINTKPNVEIKLFPNPFNNIVFIDFEERDNKLNYTFTLYNLIGEIIKHQKLNNTDTSINLEHVRKGIYYSILKDNIGNQYSFKIKK